MWKIEEHQLLELSESGDLINEVEMLQTEFW